MNRLQSELRRLYLPPAAARADGDLQPPALTRAAIDPSNAVRAMVFALARPASWETLSRVWHGVQAELEWPAPAIAVSGTDALQLWFSLAEPIAATRAHAVLDALRLRFLPEVDVGRVALWPRADAAAPHPMRHAALVPAQQAPGGDWSAFVAPDLAPVFAETPWLDIPPGEEGQAALLRGLRSTEPAAFEAAAARLGLADVGRSPPTGANAAPVCADTDTRCSAVPATREPAEHDPRRFLLRVMNDEAAPLALRVDAAKALLLHPHDRPGRPAADH